MFARFAAAMMIDKKLKKNWIKWYLRRYCIWMMGHKKLFIRLLCRCLRKGSSWCGTMGATMVKNWISWKTISKRLSSVNCRYYFHYNKCIKTSCNFMEFDGEKKHFSIIKIAKRIILTLKIHFLIFPRLLCKSSKAWRKVAEGLPMNLLRFVFRKRHAWREGRRGTLGRILMVLST